jgi:hypothetical protein
VVKKTIKVLPGIFEFKLGNIVDDECSNNTQGEFHLRSQKGGNNQVTGVRFFHLDGENQNQTNGKLEKKKNTFLMLTNVLEVKQRFSDFIKNNVFEKGIVSLLQSDEFDRFANEPENNEYKEFIFSKYPFTIDYEEPEFVADMHNFFTKKECWMDTYFSVVTETSIEDDFCFISEKPIRPMIYFHPFIVLGNPNTLKRLKQLGFETFPEFFDETYDSIIDKDIRKKMVTENVIKLCQKPIEEIHQMYISVIPKLIHNRNLLVKFAKEKRLHNEFINYLTNTSEIL